MKTKFIILLFFISSYSFSQFKLGFTTGLNFAGSRAVGSSAFNSQNELLNSNRTSFALNLIPEIYINKSSSLVFKLGFTTNKDHYDYDFESIYSQSYAQMNGIDYAFDKRLKVKSRFIRFSLLHQSYINIIDEKVFLTYNIGAGFAGIYNVHIDFYDIGTYGGELGKDKSEDRSFNVSRQENEFFVESSLGLEFVLVQNIRLKMEGTGLAGLDDLNPYKKPVSDELYENYKVVSNNHFSYLTRSISFNVGLSYFLNDNE